MFRLILQKTLVASSHAVLSDRSFVTGSCVIPHPLKIKRGGEDAHFMTSKTLGVCDGVSAWYYEDGIDAGEFAWSLGYYAQKASNKESTLTDIMEQAVNKTTLEGSATACIVKLESNTGDLHTFNLGDSGFRVIRWKQIPSGFLSKLAYYSGNTAPEALKYEIIATSKAMVHDENVPFQIGSATAPTQDLVTSADLSVIQTRIGDIVLLASDGLFDNLDDQEILDCVESVPMINVASPKKLAWRLGRKAQKKYNVIDDITVVIGHIV